jgi:hypothetical protein
MEVPIYPISIEITREIMYIVQANCLCRMLEPLCGLLYRRIKIDNL